MKFNVRVWMWTGGTFLAFTFAMCTMYGLLVPPELHSKQLLEMLLPGFRWISFGAFCLGLIETFLYGAYAGIVFALIHNGFVKLFEVNQKREQSFETAA